MAPVRKTSLFLEAQLHPALTATVLAGLGALVLGAGAAQRMGAPHLARDVRRQVRRFV